MSRAGIVVAVLSFSLATAACGDGRRAGGASEEILVFAAASLTESFDAIAAVFSRHSGVRVRLNFGPSDGLATGIQSGAPADVFASASHQWMDLVAQDPGVVDRTVFARNRLVVIVPRDNPARIGRLADLARPGVKLVLAAPSVPAGQYARDVLAAGGVTDQNVVSNEDDVKGVVQKVVLGEADAGVVYRTDVTPAVVDAVATVEIPDDVNVHASYFIGAVRGTKHRDAARAFVAFVLGDGRRILRQFGFLTTE